MDARTDPARAYLEDDLPQHEPAVRGAGGLYSAARLGLDPATCSSGFSAQALFASERFAALAQKERYFRGQQHDHKPFDFEQRLTRAPSGVQPLMGGLKSGSYVSLDQRRPNAPVRLARKIVQGFTRLVFGRGRWPAIKVKGDSMTQAFAEALVRAARLPNVLLRARNLGGAVGTVGLSWRYWQGSPRVQVHNARGLYVHDWADRELLVPGHVTEITQYSRTVWDAKAKAMVPRAFWRRRDWTRTADVTFLDVPCDEEDVEWVIDDSDGATYVHGDGFAHFVWVQNLPDLDGSCEDGESDLETLYESCDMADVIASVLASGGAKNLDPTLVLGLDPEEVGGGVSKGSDNAVAVGKGGTATYLTLPADLITGGKELLAAELRKVETTAGYVEADPDKIAAAGTSGAAIELLYGPMVAVGDTLREQYGRAIEQLLEQMIASARRRRPEESEDGELLYPVEVRSAVDAAPPAGEGAAAEEGEEEVDFYVALPPLVVEEDVIGDDGQPTGERRVVVTEVHPGKGGDVELAWGPYFPKSDADLQARATALGTAAGGKPILAQRTAVEMFAVELGRDPAEEWKRMQTQLLAEQAAQSTLYPDAGLPAPGPETQEQALPETTTEGAAPDEGAADDPSVSS